jgi:hypothetical protein
MGKIFTKVSFIVFCLLFCRAARAQSLLYYNAFNTGESTWNNYDDQLSNAIIAGGKYLLTHKQHTSTVVAPPIPVDYSRSFAIQTTFSHLSGANNYPAGLTFYGSDALNLYYFGISATGSFQVGKFDKGQTTALINWTASTAILAGGATNKLRIEKQADKERFIINGVQVAELPHLQPFGNHFGFVVMEQQTAAFDYLKLVYLAAGSNEIAVNRPLVSAAIIDPVYHTDFNADDSNQWGIAGH